MNNPFIPIFRAFSLLKHRSKVKTSMCPFASCKSVTVFADGLQAGVQDCVDVVDAYFAGKKKTCKVFVVNPAEQPLTLDKCVVLNRKDIKWFGRPKRSRKHPVVDGAEDLFINLAPKECYTAYYAMRCSKAKYKIGIYPEAKPDTLITNTAGYSQKDIFVQISSVLNALV